MEAPTVSETSFLERPRQIAPHVVILHEKLIKRKTDRYIINLGLAFSKIGYTVTLFTSQYDKNESIADIPVSSNFFFLKCKLLTAIISLQTR